MLKTLKRMRLFDWKFISLYQIEYVYGTEYGKYT